MNRCLPRRHVLALLALALACGSPGPTCATAGDKERALKAYSKSVELNPKNRNAVDRLAELTKR